MTAKFKVGDLVRYRKIAVMPQYCELGTILRVVRVATNGWAYTCEIVFGAWTEKYAYTRTAETAVFTLRELEALHDGKIQEG